MQGIIQILSGFKMRHFDWLQTVKQKKRQERGDSANACLGVARDDPASNLYQIRDINAIFQAFQALLEPGTKYSNLQQAFFVSFLLQLLCVTCTSASVIGYYYFSRNYFSMVCQVIHTKYGGITPKTQGVLTFSLSYSQSSSMSIIMCSLKVVATAWQSRFVPSAFAKRLKRVSRRVSVSLSPFGKKMKDASNFPCLTLNYRR